MEFLLNHEDFTFLDTAYDGNSEQSVELDYILPDYYPDIFKIIKCSFDPKIVSHSINGNKIIFDLIVCIKILYLSDESNNINCIEQKQTFSKSVSFDGEVINPSIKVTPMIDYINCRVINPRRLDIRGAITTKITLFTQKEQTILTQATGRCCEVKKDFVTAASKRLSSNKRVTLSEELELLAGKGKIDSIIKSDCFISQYETKIIANKVVVKGDAKVSVLYNCESDETNTQSIESMKFSAPFNQIIDIDGITEGYETMVDINVASLDILPIVAGEKNNIDCEIILFINITALKFETLELGVDAYSTKYDCEYDTVKAKLEKPPISICESDCIKAELTYDDEENEIKTVLDVFSKIKNVQGSYDSDNNIYKVFGSVEICSIIKNKDECPVYLEDTVSFEKELTVNIELLNPILEPKVLIDNTTFTILESNKIEVKIDTKICGYIKDFFKKDLLKEVRVFEDRIKDKKDNFAIKLYYAEQDEEIWEIAKKFSTSISAITAENDLTDKALLDKGMLLIPILD